MALEPVDETFKGGKQEANLLGNLDETEYKMSRFTSSVTIQGPAATLGPEFWQDLQRVSPQFRLVKILKSSGLWSTWPRYT